MSVLHEGAMRVGIVGSEAAKFTEETKGYAFEYLARLYKGDTRVTTVLSGACHLGGVDRWAVELAEAFGIPCIEYPPANLRWNDGYRPRNILIARGSDEVICITVKEFPPDYKGMRFPYCYHCKTDSHIKSGGCWTTKYARSLGKPTRTVVISAYEPYISEFFNKP